MHHEKNAYQWWAVNSSWSFLEASAKPETKLFCCMISNVYIDLVRKSTPGVETTHKEDFELC